MALDTNFATNITGAVESLTEAQKLELANVIFSATHEVGDFAPKHNVITGVRDNNLIPIITRGNYYGALSADSGDCSMNECDLTDTYSTKKWVLGEYNCRVPICLKTYSDDFKIFWGMYSQTLEDPQSEPDKNAFLSYVVDKAQRTVQGALWRTAYYGDTTSVNTLISENNGIWTEAEAGDGDKIEMTLTAGELTGEEIYNYLAEAYVEAQNSEWFNESEAVFVLSRKMATKLVTWFNSLSDRSLYNCDCYDASKMVSARAFSVDNFSVFGIKVVSYKEEQEAGKAVSVQPNYRALLINESNMLIGVETMSHLDQFDIFFDKKDRKIYVDMAIQIGAAIPLDEYVLLTEETAAVVPPVEGDE